MDPTTMPPARMHNKIARRKVQVVYYLHRVGGHVEQPHLVEGFLLPAQDGLRLKDFKKWLSAMRGAGMPESFSWSYKRNFKAGFIWQDLSNDDLIYPMQKNEYVLMGFELQVHAYAPQGTQLCNCEQYDTEGIKSGRKHMSMDSTKLHELLKEGIMDYLNVSPIKDSSLIKKTPSFVKTFKSNCDDEPHVISCSESFKAENLQSSLAGFSDCDDGHQHEMGNVETSADVRLTIAKIPSDKQRISGEVKVYKAKEMEQTTDAATQTGESKRCSTEEAMSMYVQPHFSNSLLVVAGHHPRNDGRKMSNDKSLPLFNSQQNEDVSDYADNFTLKEGMLSESHTSSGHDASMAVSLSTTSNKSDAFYSPSSVHSNRTSLETASPGSARSLRSMNSVSSTRFGSNLMPGTPMDDNGTSASPSKGGKRCSNTHILKQLLSCGSIDISEASVLSLKAMSLHNASFGSLHVGTPTQIAENRLSRSRGTPFRHQQYEDTSPPTTPKSWLCHPCGRGHGSCLSPFEGQSPSRPHSRLPSRQGSLKEMKMHNIMLASCSPAESVASKSLNGPCLLHISPPALNLSSSPKQTRY